MSSLQKVKSILLSPQQTWEQIGNENEDIGSVYTRYLMIIGVIPSIATFIGMSLIGYGAFGVSVRVPILSGIVSMVVSYALLLVMCFVVALIVDALAPTFGGQKNRANAVKVVAYGSTAGIVGGVFNAIPSLAMLGLIAALYSIYLFYLGLPTLMKCPREKAVGYTAVVVVCAFIAAMIIGSMSAMFSSPGLTALGAGGMPTGSGNASIEMNTPDGKASIESSIQDGKGNITITTKDGQLSVDAEKFEEWGKKVDALNEKLDKATESGNTAEIQKLTQELGVLISQQPVQQKSSN